MKRMKTLFTILSVILLTTIAASQQAGRAVPADMVKWSGKYPDNKFFNQPLIKNSLRRILSREDYSSVVDYNLMVPIRRVGDYLVAYSEIKYSDPQKTLSLVFDLKDGAVYIVLGEGDQRRKFSTMDNQFNLPEDVLQEIGLEQEE